MKVKTIAATIGQKFDDWLETITDDSLKERLNKGTILTGGSIASMLLRETVNDFDFYFRDYDTAQAVAEYYIADFLKRIGHVPTATQRKVEMRVERETERVRIHIQSSGVAAQTQALYQYFESRTPEATEEYANKVMEAKNAKEEKPDYRPVFFSENAITISGNIQLVIRFCGEPEKIHENYDYVHATNYWTSWDRKVVLRPDALECLLTRELRYIGSRYPICSLIRARKFIQRDWSITAGQLLKISMQIHELELTNFEVLREQLIGMDVAYFAQLLDALKDVKPDKLNSAYICEIIDRMF